MSAFLAELKKKSSAIQAERNKSTQPPAVVQTKTIESPLAIHVDIVTNRNRLDISFNRKPEQEILDKIRNAGFHYRPSDKVWFHRNSPDVRQFLDLEFGTNLEAIHASGCTPAPMSNYATPEPAGEVETEQEEVSPILAKYRREVDELIAALNVPAADILLLAISCLHEKTFPRQ